MRRGLSLALIVTGACGPSDFFGDTDADTASTDSASSGSETRDDGVQPDPSADPDPDPTATADPTVDPDPTADPRPEPVPTCEIVLPAGPACPDAPQHPTLLHDADWVWSGAIAIDDDAIYFSMSEDDFGNVARIDKCTGASDTLAPIAYPGGMAVTNDAILWSDPWDTGDLVSVPKSGGDPKPILEGVWPYALVLAGDLLVLNTEDGVWHVSLDGNTAAPYDLPPGNPYAMAFDGQSIFVADYEENIHHLDPVSGAHEVFLSDAVDSVLAADCEFVFWRDYEGVLHRTDRATLSTDDLGVLAYAVAHDAVSIYVGTEGGVTAFDKHTLQSVEFASHPRDLVANVAVDATHVYWLLPGAAQLWAAPKL